MVNTNPANKTLFQIVFDRLPEMVYNAQQVDLPGVSLGVAQMQTRFRPIPFPGTTVTYEPWSFSFIVNDDYSNWISIYEWITGLGRAENAEDLRELILQEREYGEGRIMLHNANGVLSKQFALTNVFPTRLSPVTLDVSSEQSTLITATAEFQYTSFTPIT